VFPVNALSFGFTGGKAKVADTTDMADGLSNACLTLPVVVAEGYELKGKYETFEGLKTCARNLYCEVNC
jgi:hypothetical protein